MFKMHTHSILGRKANTGKPLVLLASTVITCAISTAAQAEVNLNVHASTIVNPVPTWVLIAIFVAFAYFTALNVIHRSKP